MMLCGFSGGCMGDEFLEQQRGVVLIGGTGGGAVENFVDYLSRDSFDNADEGEPRIIAEMPLLRVSATRLVPAELRTALACPDVALAA